MAVRRMVQVEEVGQGGTEVPRFDPATGRPIIGHDATTGTLILGERPTEIVPPQE